MRAMPAQRTVLLLGGTGRTGQRVLEQLVARGVHVRALVRSPGKLSTALRQNPGVDLVVADLLSLGEDDLRHTLRGCDAVLSCLGHVLSVRGVFGRPRDLVTRATARLCRGIEALRPASPVKFVLMSSVSVNRPAGRDTRRGRLERAFLSLLRGLLPPARDNQQAADFLWRGVGTAHRCLQWVVVRPDSLLDGDVSEYALHEGLVNSIFAPARTHRANVAHFMCELITDPRAWDAWKGKFPVIVDAAPPRADLAGDPASQGL